GGERRDVPRAAGFDLYLRLLDAVDRVLLSGRRLPRRAAVSAHDRRLRQSDRSALDPGISRRALPLGGPANLRRPLLLNTFVLSSEPARLRARDVRDDARLAESMGARHHDRRAPRL